MDIPEDDDDLERKAELRACRARRDRRSRSVKNQHQLDQEVEGGDETHAGATYAVFVDGKRSGLSKDKTAKGRSSSAHPK